MDPRFYQKILQNYVFFFKKNWDIWNPKFQKNFIDYYFFFIFLAFLAFCFLFHLSKVFQKLWNFLKCFIARVRDFTNDLWKILKVHLKKILICEIIFFQNSAVYFLFFIFLLFSTFYFLFRVYVRVKKFEKFLCVFVLWTKDFIKEFWKIMEYFSKKYRHLKSKILRKSIVYYLFFLFF